MVITRAISCQQRGSHPLASLPRDSSSWDFNPIGMDEGIGYEIRPQARTTIASVNSQTPPKWIKTMVSEIADRSRRGIIQEDPRDVSLPGSNGDTVMKYSDGLGNAEPRLESERDVSNIKIRGIM